MTTRKLTPAEALECLRDWFGPMTVDKFTAKYSVIGGTDGFRACEEALAALEEALAQNPPAAPVPSDEEIESAIQGVADIGHLMERDALRLLARRIGVQGVPQ